MTSDCIVSKLCSLCTKLSFRMNNDMTNRIDIIYFISYMTYSSSIQ